MPERDDTISSALNLLDDEAARGINGGGGAPGGAGGAAAAGTGASGGAEVGDFIAGPESRVPAATETLMQRR